MIWLSTNLKKEFDQCWIFSFPKLSKIIITTFLLVGLYVGFILTIGLKIFRLILSHQNTSDFGSVSFFPMVFKMAKWSV